MRISQGSGGSASTERAAQRLAQLAAAIEGRPPVEEDAGSDVGLTSPRWDDHTRVRLPPASQEAEPTVVPEPGRHATRRRETDLLAAVRERLPATGRVVPQHLTVLALVVAAVIGATAWWLLRDRGSVVPVAVSSASPLAPTDGAPVDALAAPVSPTGSAATATASAATVTVDVVGRVRRPGIAVLRSGARVVDAIRAAGGARRGVDLSSLNLARLLVDGEQIAVGVTGAAGAPTGPSGGSAAPPGGLVNLNTATQDQLEGLPEVGPVTAEAILAYRQQNGGFTSVDQLLDVQGIGEKTMAQLEPYVTV